jgi:DnaJ-class molecular chaperone
MSTHGDGGKGSGRRNEDVSKVKSNWDLIDWSKKTEEEPKMNEDYEDIEDSDEMEYDDTCSWCGGCGEGDYDGAACRNCHGTGVEPAEKDYDDI